MPFSKGSTPGFQIPLPHKEIYNDAHPHALPTAINCLTLKRSVIPSCVLFQIFYLNILCGIVPIIIDYLELYIYIILMQMIKIYRNKKWKYYSSTMLFFFFSASCWDISLYCGQLSHNLSSSYFLMLLLYITNNLQSYLLKNAFLYCSSVPLTLMSVTVYLDCSLSKTD